MGGKLLSLEGVQRCYYKDKKQEKATNSLVTLSLLSQILEYIWVRPSWWRGVVSDFRLQLQRPILLATIVVERSGLGLSTETTAAKFTCHHSGGEKWAQILTCDHRGGKKETKTLAFDHGGGGVWAQLSLSTPGVEGYGHKISVTFNLSRETNKTQRRQPTMSLLWQISLDTIVVERSGLRLSLATTRVERTTPGPSLSTTGMEQNFCGL
ncbi:hypothetical protein B0H14DRAFT_3552565 [Mycena olivaceomarginata]|nr:hypothetical protein B0H14DRAFT_3552565 [Mycena olivaceomarginata]